VVDSAASAALGAHLLATGLANPVAAELPPVGLDRLTVVIPVRDRPGQLRRLLASIPAGVTEVIVVDDASRDPGAVAAAAHAAGATLVALERNVGAAAARNAGLVRTATEFVAFVDSDAVVDPDCFPTLLRHFADPDLALAAPRVLGLQSASPNAITRYENARSSLDLGAEPALVRPRTSIGWVSSTCLVGRTAALGAGFDPGMRVGEDVDLVWRLVESGHRVRYEPAAVVRHEHRTRLAPWLARKFFYGTGAAPLARRHPDDIAPAILPPWGVLVLVAALAQRWWSLPTVAVTALVVTDRIARRLSHVRRPRTVAARLTADGLAATAGQGMALMLRHWWPLTVIAAAASARVRRAAVLAAVADTVWEWVRVRPQLNPVQFALARRLDDAAYGAGVWWSAVRGRSARPLLPSITGLRRRDRRQRTLSRR
jgi:mycofactocin system glycosyltransferase